MKVTGDSGIALRAARFGFDKSAEKMVRDHIEPLVPILFPHLKGQSFKLLPKVMAYTPGRNEDWPVHTDGDLATLNICLSETKSFSGANLKVFSGEDDSVVEVAHQCGRAIIHPGDIPHSVTPLTRGSRFGLIIKLNHPDLNF